jgi:CRP-like cAMP-binding protein
MCTSITGGAHDTTAVCVRDSELVRMSRQSFELIARDNPTALTKLFSNMARRLSSAWEARLRRNKVGGGLASQDILLSCNRLLHHLGQVSEVEAGLLCLLLKVLSQGEVCARNCCHGTNVFPCTA